MNKVNDSNLKATEGLIGSSLSANAAETQGSVLQKLNAAANQPTAEDVEYQDLRKRSLITVNNEYPEKEYLLEMKGIKTLSLGDIHMIQAQAKQGKTTLVTIMVAAILGGVWGEVQYALKHKPKIEVFDTEQFECDTFRQYQTMMGMGHMKAEDLGIFSIYNLRGMSYEERNKFITMTIKREKPMLVVIDGIRDLVPDINDPVACPQFVQDMMKLASDVKCAIIGVLHNNPGEGKARGWLGTEWINKCGYSFEPQKENNVVTVKNTIYRCAPVPDWMFTFANDGSPVCEDYQIQYALREAELLKQRETEEAKAQKDKEHLDVVLGILKEPGKEFSRAELVTAIEEKNITGFGRRKAYDFIKEQLTLAEPPFLEVNGKMCIVEHAVQTAITFSD